MIWTSTDAGICEIIPKIEFQGTTQVLPQDWVIDGYTRSTAQKVLFFDEDMPTYGGTPSDHTVVQIVDELKNLWPQYHAVSGAVCGYDHTGTEAMA